MRTGGVTEDAPTNTATATLTVTDADGPNLARAQTDIAGTYGRFSIVDTGEWIYTLNNAVDAPTQALAANQQVTERFTVQAVDGTPDAVVITVTGANDAPSATIDEPAQSANEGTLVTLSGRGRDPDTLDRLTYAWTQLSGTAETRVTLDNIESPDNTMTMVSFTAPEISAATPLTFELTVTDPTATDPATATVLVTVNPVPGISSLALTSNAGDGVYAIGDEIEATVTFDTAVIVTGQPRLALGVGPATRRQAVAVPTDGSSRTTLAFRYTVRAGDLDEDGVSIDANALSHTADSTIRAAVDDTADALITHTVTLAASTAHRVDGIAPAVDRVTLSTTGPYIEGDAIALTATFIDAVTGQSAHRRSR